MIKYYHKLFEIQSLNKITGNHIRKKSEKSDSKSLRNNSEKVWESRFSGTPLTILWTNPLPSLLYLLRPLLTSNQFFTLKLLTLSIPHNDLKQNPLTIFWTNPLTSNQFFFQLTFNLKIQTTTKEYYFFLKLKYHLLLQIHLFFFYFFIIFQTCKSYYYK